MVIRLTEERGGGKRRKEKTQVRNGGVEDTGSFKKNGPILYFSISSDRTSIVTGSHKKYHSKQIVRLASSLPSWQACLGFQSDGKIATKKQGCFLEYLGAATIGSNNIFLDDPSTILKKQVWR